ncbi:hypothetical protein JCM8547_001807 [Rhodosporidiobolus lusitaniae]
MATTNGHNYSTRTRPTSYLPNPTLPHSHSLSEAVDLELRQQVKAAPGSSVNGERSLGHARTGSMGSSVLLSRLRPRSQVENGGGGGRDSVHTVLPYDDEVDCVQGGRGPTYGAAADDGRSLHLAGSRPVSRVSQRPRLAAQASTASLPEETTALDYLYMAEDQRYERQNGHEGYEDGMGEEEPGRQSANLSKEEAWYLLRTLVGQEIRHEEGLLWKLKNLDGEGPRGAYDEYLDPREAPILRYLVRHFLLTLPLIRDVSAEHDQAVPTFWTDGLFPIIRALHEADLSKPVDRGSASTASRLYGSSVRTALERFVSAGLKLSSSTYETSSDERASSVPMEQRATSNSTRYNFTPAVPPPVDSDTSAAPEQSGKDKKRRPSTSSSNSRRFSLGRLFGGIDRSPVKTAPPPVPHPVALPPHLPPSDFFTSTTSSASPSVPQRTSALSESDVDSHFRRSTGPARPDSAVLPQPFSFGQQIPSPPPVPPEKEAEDAGVEELDLVRTESRTTGLTGLDSASFVSAQESALVRSSGEGFEPAEGGDEDATARWSGGLVVPEQAGGVDLQRDPSGAGTVRGGAVTDTEGFELYPSDIGAVDTPTQEKAPFAFGGRSTGQATPKGKQRALEEDVEPYVVDQGSPRAASAEQQPAAPATFPLPPPIPHVHNPTLPLTVSPSPPPPPPRSPIRISSANVEKSNSRRNRFFKLRRKSTDLLASAPTAPPVPAQEEENFVAHMAIPQEFLPGRYDSFVEQDNSYQPAPVLPPVLLPKGGVPWPKDVDVDFFRGPEYEKLSYGGFEADIVGVRKGLLSHSFIIRVRRPGRLEEYVLRSEAQFARFYKALCKAFPQAHIRRLPPTDLKNDQVIRPKPSLPTIGSSVSLVSGVPGGTVDGHHSEAMSRNGSQSRQSRSRLANGLRAAADDRYNNGLVPTRTNTRTSTSGSTFARSLRAQSIHSTDGKRPRHARSATLTSLPPRPYSVIGSTRSFATTLGSRFPMPVEIGKKMPPQDPRRRALRVWLKDVLSVRTVGHHRETAAFLLLGSIVPRDSDVLDIAKRELIDDARRSARMDVAQDAIDRVRATRKLWSTVEKEVIHGEGLSEISDALKSSPSVDKLPLKYQRSVETLRTSIAETLFNILVAGESSAAAFARLKTLHAAVPYFLVKQALRIKSSSLMSRALQDILLSRPFGGKSLLQKILATCLNDDPDQMGKEMGRLEARIGSHIMCTKIIDFVHSSREKKDIIRRYASENNIELVLCIVRGADEPRLPGFELDRITKASKAHRRFAKTEPSPLDKAQVQDPDVRLVLDLQAFLVLASRDRDSSVLRELLADENFASAIEVVAQPFVQLLKRTYKVGNGPQALSDLQKFLDQLIIIVEALRSRVQDPQKSIRILARLLSRHQQTAYAFVRSCHRGETIVEEMLQWAWTASVFLRRGLAQPINLDDLLPPDHTDEKAYLLEELEDLVAYHRAKRTAQFEAAARRYAGDVDADDPILVEGDGKGKSRVEPILESKPRIPVISEILLYGNAFKEALKDVFAV